MLAQAPRVCVSSSFPEKLNRNLSIATFLAEGFGEVVGDENVRVATLRTAAATVRSFRPDLLVLVGSVVPSSTNYEELAHAAGKVGATFAFWTVEDPYEIDVHTRFARFADVVFTNEMGSAAFFDHPSVHHMPTAASRKHHWREPREAVLRPLDVFFCGVAYRSRQLFVRDAAEVLSRRRTLMAGDNWPAELPFVRNERIAASDIQDFYASSKIVLNLGRDFHIANSRFSLGANTPGPRTYEAAMAGCVQLYHLTSRAVEADFTPGEEILTFETIEELERRIGWVIDNPGAADAIAARAQARALRDHTYAERARSILATLRMAPPGPGAELQASDRRVLS